MIKRIKTLNEVQKTIPLIELTMPNELYENAIESLSSNFDEKVLFGFYELDRLIGVCGYQYTKPIYLSWTVVHPDYQHKGVGQKLLNKVIRELKKLNENFICVETYEHPMFFNAIRFYMKNEFKLIGFLPDYSKNGYTTLYLQKTF